MKRVVFVWLCTVAFDLVFGLEFSSVTDQINLQDVSGQIATFADFNADKATDILVLNANATGSVLTIYLWDNENNTFWRNDLQLLGLLPSAIVAPAVNVADFDGDGIVDLLTLSRAAGPCHTPTVHWMGVSDGRVGVENYTVLPSSVKDPPLVLEFADDMSAAHNWWDVLEMSANGDHVPDIFTASCRDRQLSLWYSQGTRRKFAPVMQTTSLEYVSSYFVDLSSDCLADIVIDGQDSEGRRALEIWEQKSYTREFSPTKDKVYISSLLGDVRVIGDLSFADMDGDGVLEVVVISCNDSSCAWPSVNILYQQKFTDTDVLNCQASSSWKLNFTHAVSVTLQGSVRRQAIQPMIGDLNLDGHPDVVTVASTDGVSSQPIFLLAVPCESGVCNGSTVTLQPQWDLLPEVGNTSHVTLFDLWEDGILDVLVCEWGFGEGSEGGGIAAFRQTLSEDHTFLKVVVLSGHCFSHCRAGVEPYGSLLPGAVVTFSTTDRNGREERNTAVMHPGSPYQLPFIVFGLGETPNFIEDLTIGAGHASGSNGSNRTAGYHQWASLVPNSQVIVITTPPDNPGRWRLELYLTPSHLVFSTAGVLCGLSIGIAMLIALLHAREKYQDSRERRQAKHRFHFNAM